MSFDQNDPKLTAYIFGELDDNERAEFETQIESSPELRRAVDETNRTLDALRGELAAEPEMRLSDGQRAAITQEIESQKSDKSPAARPATGSMRRVIAALSLAASLLVVCGVGYALMVGGPDGGWRQIAQRTSSPSAARSDFDAAEESAESAVAADEMAESIKFRSEPLGSNAQTRAKEVNALSDGLRSNMQREESARSQTATALAATPGNAAKLEPADRETSNEAPARPAPEVVAKNLEKKAAPLAAQHPTAPPVSSQAALGRSTRGATAVELGDQVLGEVELSKLRLEQEVTEARADEGQGPGQGGDKFDLIVENPFKLVKNEPLSTFSIDVDTASYAKTRMYLLQQGVMPRPDAVRIEELVNYFTYDYEPPSGDDPFAARMEVADCPWRPEHRLLRIGLKGKEIEYNQRPASNLVFLIDVSGSMRPDNKLPLLKRGMKMLVDQLGENDRVAMAVYASAAGLVLDSTGGDQKSELMGALERLHAGGSTNGGEGIRLAYQTALDNFIPGGVNRVILCTDGDFNVGTTGTDELVRLAEENAKAGVFLTVLGFGMGNHNDAMLEQISNKGNGNYAFVDSDAEANKVLVEQMSGTLVTIAKDVKIQIEFNPQQVGAYRLIGYENRMLAAEDFNDDKKDAGEIGAGHTVTALYEIVPAGAEQVLNTPPVDELKYQQQGQPSDEAAGGELLTLKLRYKQPDGDTSKLLQFPLTDEDKKFGQTDKDFRFAASVAAFGMLLRGSEHKGNATYDAVLEIAAEAAAGDTSGYRGEFLDMVRKAKELSGQ